MRVCAGQNKNMVFRGGGIYQNIEGRPTSFVASLLSPKELRGPSLSLLLKFK